MSELIRRFKNLELQRDELGKKYDQLAKQMSSLWDTMTETEHKEISRGTNLVSVNCLERKKI